jgi:hypothetical protein
MRPDPTPLVAPFPRPGPAVRLAYRELHLAATGTPEQRKALPDPARLPRPWAPATCTEPEMRAQLWHWLDTVVTWLNHQMVFDPTDVIPPCWPRHPHLVHEIAVLADQRRHAELALTSDRLEDWHRYTLPAFHERMRRRVAEHCTDSHPGVWPSAGRHSRHLDDPHTAARRQAFSQDITALAEHRGDPAQPRRLRLVDETTGELLQ